MSVVVLRGRPNLSPLPAEVGHDVWIFRVPGHRVALADRIDGLLPASWRQRDRMIIDRPKIEARTMPRVVTGIRNGIGTVPSRHGETHLERIK